VKGNSHEFLTTLFRSDPDSRALWEKYQLAITPKFYAVLSVLMLIASIRNIVGAAPPGPATLTTAIVVLTTLAGYWRQDLFPRMTRLTSLIFMPLVAWTWFAWPAGYPPPALILLPLSALFIVFADHLAMATVFVTFAGGLLWYSSGQVPPNEPGQYVLLSAFAVTTAMLYVTALLLWFLLHRLFRSRAELSAALQSSLVLRQSLLAIFFDKLSRPLTRLEQNLGGAAIAWPAVDASATEVRDILREARKVTLELGTRLDAGADSDARGLEQLRAQLWTLLLVAALVTCIVVLTTRFVGGDTIRPLGIAAALVIGTLAWICIRHGLSARARLAAIYILTGFIAANCALSLLDERAPYAIVYFYIPVFCAAFIGGTRHSVIIALVAALFVGAWYAAVPLEGPPAFMRSNIALGLVFMLAFSHIVWTWLRQLLDEIAAHHAELRRESEIRHRLMATLFHDIANPLQVIQGSAELAIDPGAAPPDVPLLRNLVKKIRSLVSFTRDFEELEKYGGELPVEPVALAPVFDDLHGAFSGMLQAKDLTLVLAPAGARVLAHGDLLGTSVLSNLLTNAIKFSPRGGTIMLSAEKTSAGRVRIEVQDEGSGFSAALVQRMLHGKATPSTAGTDGETGDGQGLRLVSLYLNCMDGKLILEPGSTIAVELPCAD
jgi:signal transduction histidine kinase